MMADRNIAKKIILLLWLGIALLVSSVGCIKPVVGVPTPSSSSEEVYLRIWVEYPENPDAYYIAARSLYGAIKASPDLEILEVTGFEESIIEVRVDRARLELIGLKFSQVVSALKDGVPKAVKDRMKVDSKSNTIEIANYMYHIDEDLVIKDIDSLTKITVKTKSGASVSIRDLASVSIGPGRPQATHRGKPALYFKVMTKGAPDRLGEVLKKFNNTQPNARVDRIPPGDWPVSANIKSAWSAAIASINKQIEKFNAEKTPSRMGITPIDQRVHRIEHHPKPGHVECFDKSGQKFLVLKRQPDGRYKGTMQVEYHEAAFSGPDDSHSWGHVNAEFYLDIGVIK
jgi:hypothetical protein